VKVLLGKAARRPPKVSLCSSTVRPSAGVSVKRCSPLIMPGRVDTHLRGRLV
jgi:hypothetical protein